MTSSLTNRIFVASALLVVAAIGVAMIVVNVAVSRQAEGEMLRGLDEAAAALDEYRQALFDHFSREARLVADLPRLKAAVALDDPPTVQPLAEEYRQLLDADLFVVAGAHGNLLAWAGPGRDHPNTTLPATDTATGSTERRSFIIHGGGILQVVSVPVWIDPAEPELLGTISVGVGLDDRVAQQFRALTNSEVAFGMHGRLYAATLAADHWPALEPLMTRAGPARTVPIGDEDYIAVTRPLATGSGVRAGGLATETAQAGGPATIILRSRTERLHFLGTVHRTLAVTALAAVLAATLVAYGIARSVTRPLDAITTVMREMAATGDLTRRLQTARSRWDDEDARLLGRTFNAMTESIARFQREAAQKERLSSLGRLSTVVAHEVRNPLMIIRAALRSLRRNELTADGRRQAVADIDEEVDRLDRLVTEVLDFARPIRFTCDGVDVNALCRDAARASMPETADAARINWCLDDGLAPVVTDRERLRLVLINVLENARQAVIARVGTGRITVTTASTGDGGASITVHDSGAGIAPADLPRVFEPFFTTRRTGTGLGLAISRNVVEGLGGTIVLTSQPGEGTTVRIDLPSRAPATA